MNTKDHHSRNSQDLHSTTMMPAPAPDTFLLASSATNYNALSSQTSDSISSSTSTSTNRATPTTAPALAYVVPFTSSSTSSNGIPPSLYITTPPNFYSSAPPSANNPTPNASSSGMPSSTSSSTPTKVAPPTAAMPIFGAGVVTLTPADPSLVVPTNGIPPHSSNDTSEKPPANQAAVAMVPTALPVPPTCSSNGGTPIGLPFTPIAFVPPTSPSSTSATPAANGEWPTATTAPPSPYGFAPAYAPYVILPYAQHGGASAAFVPIMPVPNGGVASHPMAFAPAMPMGVVAPNGQLPAPKGGPQPAGTPQRRVKQEDRTDVAGDDDMSTPQANTSSPTTPAKLRKRSTAMPSLAVGEHEEQPPRSGTHEYIDIGPLLTLPQREAARKLNMSYMQFVKRYNEATKRRWPYRRVAAIDRELKTLLGSGELVANGGPEMSTSTPPPAAGPSAEVVAAAAVAALAGDDGPEPTMPTADTTEDKAEKIRRLREERAWWLKPIYIKIN